MIFMDIKTVSNEQYNKEISGEESGLAKCWIN